MLMPLPLILAPNDTKRDTKRSLCTFGVGPLGLDANIYKSSK
jgi:hypothetical protein